MARRRKLKVSGIITLLITFIVCMALVLVLIEHFANEKDNRVGNMNFENVVREQLELNGFSKMNIDYPTTANEKVNVQIMEYIEAKKTEFIPLSKDANVKKIVLKYEKYSYSDEILSFLFETEISYTNKEDTKTIDTFVYDMDLEKKLSMKDLFLHKGYYINFENTVKQAFVEKGINDIVNIMGKDLFILEENELKIYDQSAEEEHSVTLNILDIEGLYPYYEATKNGETAKTKVEIEQMEMDDLLAKYQGKKLVALTFDDGPQPSTTPILLDILKQYEVPVTFFVLGQRVNAYPDLVLREIEEGHVVGSHSFSHKDLTIADQTSFDFEIDETKKAIYNATSIETNLLRPPYGAKNDKVVNESESAIMMWSVDPEDWLDRDVGRIADRVISHVQDGSVILLHDIYQSSVDAVPIIIERLKNEGYSFVTMDTMMKVRKGFQVGEIYYNGQ